MTRIVLDTNIIVRAVASPSGLASELLQRTISELWERVLRDDPIAFEAVVERHQGPVSLGNYLLRKRDQPIQPPSFCLSRSRVSLPTDS